MKRAWFCLVVIGALTQVLAFAQQPSTSLSNALYFDNGTIANGIYSNECLGFSLPIPAGWNLNTQIGRSDGKAMRHRRGLRLLVIDQPEQDASGMRIRIGLEALDAAVEDATAQQYVSKIVRAHSYPAERVLIRDAFGVSYGGRQFFRADY